LKEDDDDDDDDDDELNSIFQNPESRSGVANPLT
jgi:hypothetical protein